jgi:hypothetical protein
MHLHAYDLVKTTWFPDRNFKVEVKEKAEV